jgi:hypothetical protein
MRRYTEDVQRIGLVLPVSIEGAIPHVEMMHHRAGYNPARFLFVTG